MRASQCVGIYVALLGARLLLHIRSNSSSDFSSAAPPVFIQHQIWLLPIVVIWFESAEAATGLFPYMANKIPFHLGIPMYPGIIFKPPLFNSMLYGVHDILDSKNSILNTRSSRPSHLCIQTFFLRASPTSTTSKHFYGNLSSSLSANSALPET